MQFFLSCPRTRHCVCRDGYNVLKRNHVTYPFVCSGRGRAYRANEVHAICMHDPWCQELHT